MATCQIRLASDWKFMIIMLKSYPNPCQTILDVSPTGGTPRPLGLIHPRIGTAHGVFSAHPLHPEQEQLLKCHLTLVSELGFLKVSRLSVQNVSRPLMSSTHIDPKLFQKYIVALLVRKFVYLLFPHVNSQTRSSGCYLPPETPNIKNFDQTFGQILGSRFIIIYIFQPPDSVQK